MTKEECAVVMAYTGVCMLQGDDLGYYYEYVERLLGRPVYTHELATERIVEAIQEKSRPDFVSLCSSAR